MRIMSLLLGAAALLSVSAAPGPATAQEPPGLIVLKHGWNEHVNRPDWDRDLYRNPIKAAEDEREQVERARDPRARAPILGPGELPPVPEYRRKQTLNGTRGFQYRVTVKNAGGGAIRSIVWDYIFIDPRGGGEVARHSFESRARIKPGGRKELVEFSVSAPTKVVSADVLGGADARRPFTERVVIKRVEYADGSVWTRPQH